MNYLSSAKRHKSLMPLSPYNMTVAWSTGNESIHNASVVRTVANSRPNRSFAESID